MTSSGRFDRNSLDAGQRDVSTWALVNLKQLDYEDEQRVLKFQTVVGRYLAGDKVSDICESTGIYRCDIIRAVKRCLQIHADGRVWGFRALIPYTHQVGYVRTKPVSAVGSSAGRGGRAGALTQLFDRFPQLAELVEGLFLKRLADNTIHESRIPLKSIHKHFLKNCRALGLTAGDYPLNQKYLGRGALWSHLKGHVQCLFCRSRIPAYHWLANGSTSVQCKVCGPYRLLERAGMDLHAGGGEGRSHLLSGAIREKNERGIEVVVHSLDDLVASMSVPEGPLERIDRIVLYVLRKMATDDATVTLRPDCDYSVAYARTPAEFEFLIERAVELQYIELASGGDQYRLRLKGWEHASQLARAQIKSKQAFVAMSFSPELSSVYYNAIKPALKHCGYLPLRVDQVEYNDKIDDRIVADIRSSGIMVADFTEHKAGVYFESGLAMGLGLEVIRTCRDTDLKDTHFDTRQYNHIVWKDEVELKDKLVARIQATVPLKRQPRAVSD